MSLILIIVVIIGAFLIIGNIIYWIDWKKIALKYVGDKEDRAIIYDRIGNKEFKYTAKLAYRNDTGTRWDYEKDKKMEFVITPVEYPVVWIEGYQKILVKNGRPIALDLDSGKEELKYEMFKKLVFSSVIKESVDEMEQSRGFKLNWKHAVVGAIIIGGMVFVIMNLMSNMGQSESTKVIEVIKYV